MAEPIEFPEVNCKWTGPGDIGDLPVFRDENGCNISCWELTAEEQVEVLNTGKVWLHVWGTHPPVAVSGTAPDNRQPNEDTG